MHEGPVPVYEGANGSEVELWHRAPEMPAGCPNLVYRFGDWFVGVRTCQGELSEPDRRAWARLLDGDVTRDGSLVLSATNPLRLRQLGARLRSRGTRALNSSHQFRVPGASDACCVHVEYLSQSPRESKTRALEAPEGRITWVFHNNGPSCPRVSECSWSHALQGPADSGAAETK